MLNDKVVDLFIDEDSKVGYGEYDLEGFKEKSKYWLGIFVDKYGVVVSNSIVMEKYVEESFDYEGGEEEKEKFVGLMEKVNGMIGEGDVVIGYGVEYDISWCVMSGENWEKFKRMCEESEEE